MAFRQSKSRKNRRKSRTSRKRYRGGDRGPICPCCGNSLICGDTCSVCTYENTSICTQDMLSKRVVQERQRPNMFQRFNR